MHFLSFTIVGGIFHEQAEFKSKVTFSITLTVQHMIKH